MMEEHEIARRVRERRQECGIGLCGRIDMIVKWLNDEHGVLTDGKTVEHWLKQKPATEPARRLYRHESYAPEGVSVDD